MELSNPKKILFPKDKVTKEMIASYYKRVAPLMLPLIKDHPCVMERFPNGIKAKGFFQKNIDKSFPKWISKVSVKRKSASRGHLLLCQNQKTLFYLSQIACITPHLWLSAKNSLEKPDRIIFDLDPPKGNPSLAKEAALHLKTILEEKGKLKAFLMTSGSKGFHVVVPIKPFYPFERVRFFAKKIAEILVEERPEKFSVAPRKALRKNRLFIDYLRNAYAQHAVAPYALRPLDGAPIAMPISWEELSNTTPQSFSLKNIEKRLKAHKNPWSSFKKSARSLTKAFSHLPHTETKR